MTDLNTAYYLVLFVLYLEFFFIFMVYINPSIDIVIKYIASFTKYFFCIVCDDFNITVNPCDINGYDDIEENDGTEDSVISQSDEYDMDDYNEIERNNYGDDEINDNFRPTVVSQPYSCGNSFNNRSINGLFSLLRKIRKEQIEIRKEQAKLRDESYFNNRKIIRKLDEMSKLITNSEIEKLDTELSLRYLAYNNNSKREESEFESALDECVL